MEHGFRIAELQPLILNPGVQLSERSNHYSPAPVITKRRFNSIDHVSDLSDCFSQQVPKFKSKR